MNTLKSYEKKLKMYMTMTVITFIPKEPNDQTNQKLTRIYDNMILLNKQCIKIIWLNVNKDLFLSSYY